MSYELKFPVSTPGSGALDELIAKVQHIGGAAAESSKGFEGFAESLKNFIQNPMQAAGGAAESFLKTLGSAGAITLAAATGIGAIGKAGMDAMEHLGKLGIEIGNVSIRTGLSVKEVSQFSFAAKAAGSDIGAFEMAMRRLSEGLSESGAESNKARQELARLGITTKEPKQIFIEFGEALSHMSSAADRNASAIRLFGRAGMELVPVLMSLNQSLAEAKELGIGPSEADIAQWEKYHQKMEVIEVKWGQLVRKLQQGIAIPVFWMMGGDSEHGSKFGNVASAYGLDIWSTGPIADQLDKQRNKMAAHGLDVADLAGLGVLQGDYNLNQFQSGIDATKEGVTAKYNAAQGALVAAQDGVTSAHGKGTKAVNEAKQAYIEAHAEVEKYKAALDGFRAAEEAANKLNAYGEASNDAQLTPIQREIKKANKVGGDPRAMLFGGNVLSGMMGMGYTFGGAQSEANRNFPGSYAGMVGRLAGPLNQVKLDDSGDKDQTSRLANDTKTFQEALKKIISDDDGTVKVLLDSLNKLDSITNDHAVRMLQIQLGDSEASIRTIAEKRIEGAKDAYDAQKYLYDAEEQIAALRKKQSDDLQAQADRLASDLFNGMMGGGKGMTSMIENLLKQQGGQIFTNITSGYLKSGIQELGKLGDSSGFSKFLGGTLLEHKNAALETATAANTAATVANTTALARAAMGGFGGGAGGGSAWVGNGASYGTDDYGNPTFGNPVYSPDGSGTAPSTSFFKSPQFAKSVASAAAIGAGAFAAYDGFSRGGARGVTEGIGGLAGVAGGIVSLAGVTGPLAPIMAGVGMALGVITSMFGDPKQNRARDLERQAQKNSYDMPTGTAYNVDTYGRNIDYGANGGPRVVVNMNVSTLDAKSFMDRAPEIHEMMRSGLNTYAPLRLAIQGAINS